MRAVVTVMGIDKPGIIAKVSTCLSECGVNILDINQTIMQNIFTMIMLVDITNSNVDFSTVTERLEAVGTEMEVQITFQHEDIFNSMHRI